MNLTESAGTPSAPSSEDPAANVGKIRDILFGSQMREYEGRFAKIEQRLFDELSNLRQDLTDRLARIEQDLRNETRKLGEATLRERNERLEALHSLDLSTARLGEDLLSRVTTLDRQTGDNLASLREQLESALLQRFTELADQLQGLDRRLDGAKAGRSEMASLLGELAARLNSSAS